MVKKGLKENKVKCKCCDKLGVYNYGDNEALCKKHYDKLRNSGDLNAKENCKNGICEADGCGNVATRKGMCGKHYSRFRVYGDKNYKIKHEVYIEGSCPVNGCGKKIKSRGLCATHYRRLLSNGDPHIKRNRYDNYTKNEKCIMCGNVIPKEFDSLEFCSYRCRNRHKDGKEDLSVCICGKKFKSIKGSLTCSDECKKLYKFLRIKEWNEKQRMENENYLRLRAAVQRRRRSKKEMAIVEEFTDIEIFERDLWVCGICRCAVDKNKKYPHPMCATMDHIIPLSKGGNHTKSNVQLSHFICNRKKGSKENFVISRAG